MTLPAMHGWTHRPKSEGGTDPIPITVSGGITWATASAGMASVTASGGKFRPTLGSAYASDSTGYALTSGWLQINDPGYYVLKAVIIKSGVFNTAANDYFVQALFDQAGTPADIQDNQGVADYLGDWRTPNAQLLTGDQAGTTLATHMTFNWNPDSPVSDLDFENPLKVSVLVATNPFLGGTLTIGAMVHVMRIADAGYVTL